MSGPRPERLEEYAHLALPAGDPELRAVAAAVLVEDLVDVTLRDGEIDLAMLGTPEALAAFLADREEDG